MINFAPDLAFARDKDQSDPLFRFRERFHIPGRAGKELLYFCGNSLGLQPKSVSYLMNQELEDWARFGVDGHFKAKNPWFSYHKLFSERLGKLVGALPDEVVAANSLTINLHLLLISFFKPQGKRTKILMEAGAFPSDQYAIESQLRMHGLDPDAHLIEVGPRPGTDVIAMEDILEVIETEGENLALIIMGGVHYYSGQYFDLKEITRAGQKQGALVGFDLAHAAGNVALSLHDWNVDFACWCSYKYLNGGPGAVGGLFVHERHGKNPDTFRLAGWWGHQEAQRFKMEKGFQAEPGAAGWQLSNAPVLNMVGLHASLDIFEKAGMDLIVEKSRDLTQYFAYLLDQIPHPPFRVLTPQDPDQRGAQISLYFHQKGKQVFEALEAKGVVADWREPGVIRMAPVPLYNRYEDVYEAVRLIREACGLSAS